MQQQEQMQDEEAYRQEQRQQQRAETGLRQRRPVTSLPVQQQHVADRDGDDITRAVSSTCNRSNTKCSSRSSSQMRFPRGGTRMCASSGSSSTVSASCRGGSGGISLQSNDSDFVSRFERQRVRRGYPGEAPEGTGRGREFYRPVIAPAAAVAPEEASMRQQETASSTLSSNFTAAALDDGVEPTTAAVGRLSDNSVPCLPLPLSTMDRVARQQQPPPAPPTAAGRGAAAGGRGGAGGAADQQQQQANRCRRSPGSSRAFAEGQQQQQIKRLLAQRRTAAAAAPRPPAPPPVPFGHAHALRVLLSPDPSCCISGSSDACCCSASVDCSSRSNSRTRRSGTLSQSSTHCHVGKPLSAADEGAKGIDDAAFKKQQQRECIICFESSACVAVGPCQHFCCWMCGMKLRLFTPHTPAAAACAFCKVEAPYLLFLYLPALFSSPSDATTTVLAPLFPRRSSITSERHAAKDREQEQASPAEGSQEQRQLSLSQKHQQQDDQVQQQQQAHPTFSRSCLLSRLSSNGVEPAAAAAFLQAPYFTSAAAAALPPHLRDTDSGFCFASPAIRRAVEATLQLRCWMQPCRSLWMSSFVFRDDQDSLLQDMLRGLQQQQQRLQQQQQQQQRRPRHQQQRPQQQQQQLLQGISPGAPGSSAGSESAAGVTTASSSLASGEGAPDAAAQKVETCYPCWSYTVEEGRHVYSSLQQLNAHMRQQHGGVAYCEVCVKGRQPQLLAEQLLYAAPLLQEHLQQGQLQKRGGFSSSSSSKSCGVTGAVSVHPKCRVCSERLLDEEAYLLHIRNEHFYCVLCEEVVLASMAAVDAAPSSSAAARRRGQGAAATAAGAGERQTAAAGSTSELRHQRSGSDAAAGASATLARRKKEAQKQEAVEDIPVFARLPELQQHFREQHFPCPHVESCPLTVFRSNAEVYVHLATVHGGSKRAAPAAGGGGTAAASSTFSPLTGAAFMGSYNGGGSSAAAASGGGTAARGVLVPSQLCFNYRSYEEERQQQQRQQQRSGSRRRRRGAPRRGEAAAAAAAALSAGDAAAAAAPPRGGAGTAATAAAGYTVAVDQQQTMERQEVELTEHADTSHQPYVAARREGSFASPHAAVAARAATPTTTSASAYQEAVAGAGTVPLLPPGLTPASGYAAAASAATQESAKKQRDAVAAASSVSVADAAPVVVAAATPAHAYPAAVGAAQGSTAVVAASSNSSRSLLRSSDTAAVCDEGAVGDGSLEHQLERLWETLSQQQQNELLLEVEAAFTYVAAAWVNNQLHAVEEANACVREAARQLDRLPQQQHQRIKEALRLLRETCRTQHVQDGVQLLQQVQQQQQLHQQQQNQEMQNAFDAFIVKLLVALWGESGSSQNGCSAGDSSSSKCIAVTIVLPPQEPQQLLPGLRGNAAAATAAERRIVEGPASHRGRLLVLLLRAAAAAVPAAGKKKKEEKANQMNRAAADTSDSERYRQLLLRALQFSWKKMEKAAAATEETAVTASVLSSSNIRCQQRSDEQQEICSGYSPAATTAVAPPGATAPEAARGGSRPPAATAAQERDYVEEWKREAAVTAAAEGCSTSAAACFGPLFSFLESLTWVVEKAFRVQASSLPSALLHEEQRQHQQQRQRQEQQQQGHGNQTQEAHRGDGKRRDRQGRLPQAVLQLQREQQQKPPAWGGGLSSSSGEDSSSLSTLTHASVVRLQDQRGLRLSDQLQQQAEGEGDAALKQSSLAALRDAEETIKDVIACRSQSLGETQEDIHADAASLVGSLLLVLVQSELQQLALLARDLAAFIDNTKLLEEIQALGPAYYRLRASADEARSLTQWLSRCAAVLFSSTLSPSDWHALRCYLGEAAALRPQRERQEQFPSLAAATTTSLPSGSSSSSRVGGAAATRGGGGGASGAGVVAPGRAAATAETRTAGQRSGMTASESWASACKKKPCSRSFAVAAADFPALPARAPQQQQQPRREEQQNARQLQYSRQQQQQQQRQRPEEQQQHEPEDREQGRPSSSRHVSLSSSAAFPSLPQRNNAQQQRFKREENNCWITPSSAEQHPKVECAACTKLNSTTRTVCSACGCVLLVPSSSSRAEKNEEEGEEEEGGEDGQRTTAAETAAAHVRQQRAAHKQVLLRFG